MVDIFTYPILSNHITTLKDTSIDKRDGGTVIYMTESSRQVINFDEVKEEYVKFLKLNEMPKSNDALMTDKKNKLIFVEFKNGYMDRAKQYAVRKKIYDSVLIFSDIVSIGISEMRTYIEYILVYNEAVNEKNPDVIKEKKTHIQPSTSFNSFAKGVSSLANEEYVCFGVKIFENYCFKKVHTYTEREFEHYLSAF